MQFHKIQLLHVCLIFGGCGSAGGGSDAPTFSYSLEREATGSTINALIMELPDDSNYTYSIFGKDFDSDVVMDEKLPLTERTTFTYTAEGEYNVVLDVFQHDGTPFLSDTLSWTYSTTIPEDPIISFSEIATPDTAITMQIADSRLVDTTDIWVEGSGLAGANATGFWDTLSESGLYPLTTTAPDGVKNMRVKLRNIYGNESSFVDASIVKKSVGPTDCLAEISTAISSTTAIFLKLQATNDGPLYYAVYGDVDEVEDFRTFSNGSQVQVQLTAGTGDKVITVHIKDAANNTCDPIQHTISVQNGHVVQSMVLNGEPIWTNTTSQTLDINYDHFPSEEPIEMKITGDVTGANAKIWIPYSTSQSIELTPGDGQKTLFVQFRDVEGDESFLVSARVFLNPGMSLNDAGGGNENVVVDNVIGLNHITITGCVETYNQVDYASSYFCTPAAATIDVLYTFDDDTTVSLSEAP